MRLTTLSLTASMLLAASPVHAQDDGDSQWQAMSDAELGRSASDFMQYPSQAPCTRGVPAMQELASRYPDNDRYAGGYLFAQTICAMTEERWDDAWAFSTRLEADHQGYNPFLGLQIAVEREDAEQAEMRLRYFVEETDLSFENPYEAFVVSGARRVLLSQDRQSALSRIALKAFRDDRFETLSDGFRAAFAVDVLREPDDLSREDINALLEEFNNPPSVLQLLASRDFEAVWPILEERVGPNLGTVGAAYVKRMENEFSEAPDDGDALRELAYAYYFDGRFGEIIALYESQRQGPYADRQLDEPMAWVANLAAYAMDVEGRKEEADAIMDELAGYDENEFDWLVNFVINRASRLVSDGRYEEGLAATVRAREVADRMGTPYARMLVARDRLCALTQLGRAQEAEPELARIREAADQSPLYVSSALLCAGLEGEARQIIVDVVSDPDRLEAYLVDLQPNDFDPFGVPGELPDPRYLLWDDPELRALFEERGRIIPDRFLPRATLIRSEAAQRLD